MKIQSKRLNWVGRRASVAQGRARLEGAANPSILASQVAEDLGKVRRSGRSARFVFRHSRSRLRRVRAGSRHPLSQRPGIPLR